MTNRTNGYRQVKGFGSTATIWLLLIALWIAMGVHSGEAFGAEQLEYLDEEGNSKYIDDYTVLTESIDTIEGDYYGKWYVVKDDLEPTSKVITVNETAKLLLTNGCRLSAERISVTGGNRLEIYTQSTDKTRMGRLECHQKTLGGAGRAAIGGDESENAGDIVIWGGHISASAKGASAIGGGVGQSSGQVAIKDGVVKASSNDSSTAVIGGAKEGRGGSVIIDGGDVDVTGGGTGIGAGRQSENEVSVSINAGTVTAQGDGNGYVAIGADQADDQKPGAAAKVAIGGGHVKAISSNDISGIGIGSKKGAAVRINGGTVEAKGKDAGVGAQVPEGTEWRRCSRPVWLPKWTHLPSTKSPPSSPMSTRCNTIKGCREPAGLCRSMVPIRIMIFISRNVTLPVPTTMFSASGRSAIKSMTPRRK